MHTQNEFRNRDAGQYAEGRAIYTVCCVPQTLAFEVSSNEFFAAAPLDIAQSR